MAVIGVDASRAAARQRTGTENYSWQVIRRLPGAGADHQWRLYSSRPLPAGFWQAGAAVDTAGPAPANVDVRVIPFPRLWTHLRLSAEMAAHPPDTLFVPAHVLPLLHPRRSVVTIHDLGYLYHPEAHPANSRRYLHWSTGWSAAQARVVLADSQATRADLVRHYHVAPEKVRVIYLGRDETLAPERDPVVRSEIRARYGLAGRYLLYVGTLQPRKNLARLAQAFATLCGRPEFAGVQLVLAGRRGWLADGMLAEIERLGLGGRLALPGYVANADLAALYSGALAHVFPSLYEGFGIPVLEAQACGAPVMTSNNSSLPEVAGDAALLVDPHDVDAIAEAMWRLVTVPELRAELSRRGLANAQRFSWDKCAAETLAVLEEVAQSAA